MPGTRQIAELKSFQPIASMSWVVAIFGLPSGCDWRKLRETSRSREHDEGITLAQLSCDILFLPACARAAVVRISISNSLDCCPVDLHPMSEPRTIDERIARAATGASI